MGRLALGCWWLSGTDAKFMEPLTISSAWGVIPEVEGNLNRLDVLQPIDPLLEQKEAFLSTPFPPSSSGYRYIGMLHLATNRLPLP